MAGDCAIPLVAERSVTVITAKNGFSIVFLQIELPIGSCFVRRVGQQEVGQWSAHGVFKRKLQMIHRDSES